MWPLMPVLASVEITKAGPCSTMEQSNNGAIELTRLLPVAAADFEVNDRLSHSGAPVIR
jgi:hypothetical protein